MGSFLTKKKETALEGEQVTFDHFHVLRAIGRGSFGKVCIVQKKDSKQMYAMKYMNKLQCEQKEALNNVFREIEILSALSHPFLVNLWFSFQDAEDMFMVVELLLGGDLRYHLQQGVIFNDEAIRLLVYEAGSALNYLHTRNIIHRDIKPDNLLLDEEGHVHLTDFNIAAVVRSDQLATSMSGTKPYMAPEVYECAADECIGYDNAVDWWSLGVSIYEIRRGKRPYDIHSSTPLTEIRKMFFNTLRIPGEINPGIAELISRLLVVDPKRRLKTIEEIRKIPFMACLKIEDVLNKKNKPIFTPPKDHLNCDPTFELEEMIIESKPLHKKKKRLSKQKSLSHTSQSENMEAEERYGGMMVYNREVEERKREKERKEREREKNWQEELEESMRLSDPTGHGCTFSGSQCNTPIKVKSTQGLARSSEVSLGHLEAPPPLTLAYEDLKHVTRSAVSPSSVRARIAHSPKVKVRGNTVTIESSKSSSSSGNKSNVVYLQERLKELQAEQKKPKNESETNDVTESGSQSQVREKEGTANQETGCKNASEKKEEEEEEKDEEEEEEKATTTTTTTLSNNKCNNNNNNSKDNLDDHNETSK